MSIRVIIETPGPIYSGSQIQGKFICTFTDVQRIRNIKVRIYGREHTEWWRNESTYDAVNKRQQTRRVKYCGDYNLFSMETLVFGERVGELEIGPGSFTYPFTFILPPNLPGSFQNQHGSIRYCIKGTVDVLWELDFEDEACFVVVTPIDLNNFPSEWFQPASVADEKTICCWCCTSGLITVTANINKIAFVLGENINLVIAITNLSRSNIYGVQARLVQFIKSSVHYPKFEAKTDEFKLVDESWSGVGAHGQRTYDIELKIPNSAVLPNFQGSSLFEIRHKLEIVIKIRGFHMHINRYFNVNLGHVHHTNGNPTMDSRSVLNRPSAPSMDEPPDYATVVEKPAQFPGNKEGEYFEQPPPSYEEITRMN